jgi:hypothetical protein
VKDPIILSHDSRIAFYANAQLVLVEGDLEDKTVDQQGKVVRDILREASSRRASFVFLKGALYSEAQRAARVSGGVEEIKEWRSPHGNSYTLFRLRTHG